MLYFLGVLEVGGRTEVARARSARRFVIGGSDDDVGEGVSYDWFNT